MTKHTILYFMAGAALTAEDRKETAKLAERGTVAFRNAQWATPEDGIEHFDELAGAVPEFYKDYEKNLELMAQELDAQENQDGSTMQSSINGNVEIVDLGGSLFSSHVEEPTTATAKKTKTKKVAVEDAAAEAPPVTKSKRVRAALDKKNADAKSEVAPKE